MKSCCEMCFLFLRNDCWLLTDLILPVTRNKELPPKELRAEKKQPKRKTTQENTKIHTPDLANKKCLKTTSDCVGHIHKRNTSNPLFNQQAVYRYSPFPPLLICWHPWLRYFNQDRMDKWLTQACWQKSLVVVLGFWYKVVDRPR